MPKKDKITNKEKVNLYVATQSPRRLEILKKSNIQITPIPNLLCPEPPFDTQKELLTQIRTLCHQKAFVSKKDYKGLILGADTIVVLGKKILGKPKTILEAKETLRFLSNKTHTVISGISILNTTTKKVISRTEKTYVTFSKLQPADINKYCDDFKPIDKAGSYGIQEVPPHFVKKINGCYFNVMGLPIKSLLKVLRNYVIV